MAIKYSVDELTINEYAGKGRIMINGWCASTDGKVPELKVVVNGKSKSYSIVYVNRFDAIKIMKLPEEVVRCGFMLNIKTLHEPINTLQVVAQTSSEKRFIVDLNESIIVSLKETHSIIAKIDGISYDKDSKMMHLSGWAISEDDNPLTFNVRHTNGEVQKCDARQLSRDDLVRLGYVEQSNKFCGFMISYPGKKEKAELLIESKSDHISLPIEITNQRNILFTIHSLISNINGNTITKAFRFLKRYGIVKTIQRLSQGYVPSGAYDDWFREHMVTDEELSEQRKMKFSYCPKISLIVPTYNTPLDFLDEMIGTVRKQSYSNWELCIADGSDPSNPARKAIEKYAKKDNRIKIAYLDKNYGISGNTNEALKLVTGDYTAMYDHDDFLELNALYEIVNVLNKERYDIIYTDEDKYSMATHKFEDPNLKPDFSIDLLRSHNYITHLFVVRTDILREVGGFHKEYDGAQDYDVILRCSEKTDKIYHLPKIVYHWRMHAGSTAEDPESKMYCYEAGQKAIETHLQRVGVDAKVSMLGKPYYGLYHVKYATKDNPLVSIVIPNYENRDVLKRCIDSLFNVNQYTNFEVIIVENNSTSEDIFAYYKELESEHANVHVVTWEGKEFNYSAINNYGVQYAKGDYLLFLNNDTEVISPEAISEMLGCCMREEVGIVGAKLLYEDDTVQHAGVVIGFGGAAGHVFSRIGKNDAGFMMRPLINCNYSAVTAACMITKKDLFTKVNGFDEELKVAFNDIDFCLKVRNLNKLVVYNAFSLWHHYESISRGYETSPEKSARFEKEIKLFQARWQKILVEGDPYYNANFDVSYSPFELH